jgi:hypothetical protein
MENLSKETGFSYQNNGFIEQGQADFTFSVFALRQILLGSAYYRNGSDGFPLESVHCYLLTKLACYLADIAYYVGSSQKVRLNRNNMVMIKLFIEYRMSQCLMVKEQDKERERKGFNPDTWGGLERLLLEVNLYLEEHY